MLSRKLLLKQPKMIIWDLCTWNRRKVDYIIPSTSTTGHRRTTVKLFEPK